MRRSEVLEGLSQIETALNTSGIPEVLSDCLEAAVDGQSTVASSATLDAFRNYSTLVANYSPAAIEISRTLGLDPLIDSEFWSGILSNSVSLQQLKDVCRNTAFAIEQLPKFADVLRVTDSATRRAFDSGSGYTTLTLLLMEDGQNGIAPQRISNALESIQLLYDGCSLLQNERSADLRVVACDSGNDTAFELRGKRSVLANLREVLSNLWNLILAHRDLSVPDRIEKLPAKLDVMDQLDSLVSSGELNDEEARIARAYIADGVKSFIETGSAIPEMRHLSVDARSLLLPSKTTTQHESSVDPHAPATPTYSAVAAAAAIPTATASTIPDVPQSQVITEREIPIPVQVTHASEQNTFDIVADGATEFEFDPSAEATEEPRSTDPDETEARSSEPEEHDEYDSESDLTTEEQDLVHKLQHSE